MNLSDNLRYIYEGASAEVHDLRVGLNGSWRSIVAAIENAKDLGTRFITNSTIPRISVEEMFRILDLLDELGVPKMNIGNTLPEYAGRNRSMMMQYPEVVEIAEELTLYALTKRVAFSFITPLPLCLKDGRVISNSSVCSAGHYSTVIDTDGTCRPCSVCNPAEWSCPKLHDLASYREIGSCLEKVVREYVCGSVPAECKLVRECRSVKRAALCTGKYLEWLRLGNGEWRKKGQVLNCV